MKAYPCILALLAAACGGLPSYSAPAPEGSLRCAVEEAHDLGYRTLEGRTEEGGVRLGRPVAPLPADRPLDRREELGEAVLTDWEDVAMQSQLRVSHQDGRLRVEVLSEREPGPLSERTGGAEADAQRILAACSATPA